MPRAIWSGSISFGLISLPVKAYAATSSERINFDLLHDEDGGRIEYKRVCKVDGKEVSWDHIVKGYEISPGNYVTFTKEELAELQPEATHTIDIEDFVQLEEIDPMFFDSPYHLLPEPGARRAYELLHTVMSEAGVVALARVVLRTRERFVSIRPLEGGTLAMETMHFAAELRDIPELADDGRAKKAAPSKREQEMARSLVDELTTSFDPQRYHDTYREEVIERIEQKAAGKTIETPDTSAPEATPTNDIMQALEASLAAARAKRESKGASKSKPRATAAAATKSTSASTKKTVTKKTATKKPAAKKTRAKQPAAARRTTTSAATTRKKRGH